MENEDILLVIEYSIGIKRHNEYGAFSFQQALSEIIQGVMGDSFEKNSF